MSDYCVCKDCEYCDLNECSGYKCHCDRYKVYVDPDEVTECKSSASADRLKEAKRQAICPPFLFLGVFFLFLL